MMSVVFVSNVCTIHQRPLSEALFRRTDGNFRFVETEALSQERKSLGWEVDSVPQYVLPPAKTEEVRAEQQAMVNAADVAIIGCGSAPDSWVRQRIREGKLTFFYSERIYKNGCPSWQIPLRWIKNRMRFGSCRNLYLLCASAYTAADFSRTGNFRGHAFRLGYFPECRTYAPGALMQKKAAPGHTVRLVWVGRFLEWKHPEAAIKLAEALLKKGMDFSLEMIGSGVLLEPMQKLAAEAGLNQCVRFTGAIPADTVRSHMEAADVFLMTSDFQEGWGAVLNEAMNSGCAVIASHAAGASPYLIRDGENGFLYESGNFDDLLEKALCLMTDCELRRKMADAAYQTIVQQWNAEEAAGRFLCLAENLLQGGGGELYSDGPCSPALVMKNDWF